MRAPVVWIVCLALWAGGALAQEAPDQLEFPQLTGRVVDQAELLDTQAEARITQMLAAHEQATSEQLVVVTVPDLQGRSIEEYGVGLGRSWGIGQQGEDNGALLIVARDDRRVRIEVGYGLEGRLTDAQSSLIINRIIVPAFREGDFQRGIVEGTQAVVQVLGGDPLRSPAQRAAGQRPEQPPVGIFILLLFIVLGMIGGRGGRRGRGRFGSALLAGALLGGMGRGGGLGGGGGFGGGGGGFGGGGASGGW